MYIMYVFCSQLLTDTASSGGSPSFLIGVYQKLFGSQTHPAIVRYNDFSDIAAYFVQKVRSTSSLFHSTIQNTKTVCACSLWGKMFLSIPLLPPFPSLPLHKSLFLCPYRPFLCV